MIQSKSRKYFHVVAANNVDQEINMRTQKISKRNLPFRNQFEQLTRSFNSTQRTKSSLSQIIKQTTSRNLLSQNSNKRTTAVVSLNDTLNGERIQLRSNESKLR